MGMCKGCKEVFNTNDMIDGYCQNCMTDEMKKKLKVIKQEDEIRFEKEKELNSLKARKIINFIASYIIFSIVYAIIFNVSPQQSSLGNILIVGLAFAFIDYNGWPYSNTSIGMSMFGLLGESKRIKDKKNEVAYVLSQYFKQDTDRELLYGYSTVSFIWKLIESIRISLYETINNPKLIATATIMALIDNAKSNDTYRLMYFRALISDMFKSLEKDEIAFSKEEIELYNTIKNRYSENNEENMIYIKKQKIANFLSQYIKDDVNRSFLYGHSADRFILFNIIEAQSLDGSFLYERMNPKLIAIVFLSSTIYYERKYGNYEEDATKPYRLTYLVEAIINMIYDIEKERNTFSDEELEYYTAIKRNYNMDNYEKYHFNSGKFEEWFNILKNEASKHHEQLFITEDRISYFDLVVQDSFHLAYKNKLNPKILAEEIAEALGNNFNIIDDILKKEHSVSNETSKELDNQIQTSLNNQEKYSEIDKNYHRKMYDLRTKQTATRNDFPIHPLTDTFIGFDFEMVFTLDEMEDIKKGWHCTGMNDRWFIYYEDDKLYICRTPSKYCQYIAYFKLMDNGTYLLYKIKYNGREEFAQNENNARYWVKYLITGVLIAFRRAHIDPEDVFSGKAQAFIDPEYKAINYSN